jgi:hypothetical protein
MLSDAIKNRFEKMEDFRANFDLLPNLIHKESDVLQNSHEETKRTRVHLYFPTPNDQPCLILCEPTIWKIATANE